MLKRRLVAESTDTSKTMTTVTLVDVVQRISHFTEDQKNVFWEAADYVHRQNFHCHRAWRRFYLLVGCLFILLVSAGLDSLNLAPDTFEARLLNVLVIACCIFGWLIWTAFDKERREVEPAATLIAQCAVNGASRRWLDDAALIVHRKQTLWTKAMLVLGR